MKNSQKRFTAAWLVVIIIVVLLAVGGYYVYHQSNISTPLDTSEWKQYSNMDLGLAIKYPPLHDPVSANQPRETIHEDPQEVGFMESGDDYLALEKYASDYCKTIYSQIDASEKVLQIGHLSYYYFDHNLTTELTFNGGFPAYYISVPNSFSDGGCLIMNFSSRHDDIAYAMLQSLSLKPTTTTNIVGPIDYYKTAADVTALGANKFFQDNHSYLGLCASLVKNNQFSDVSNQTPICREESNAYIDYVLIGTDIGYMCVDSSGKSSIVRDVPTGFICLSSK